MEQGPTLSEVAQQPAPRSFWRERLARLAAPLSVHEYLIDESNLRGYRGAFRSVPIVRPPNLALTLEDLVVGLLAPQAPADARTFKLVVRLFQGGKLDLRRLLLRAKRERSLGALYWLLQQVPAEEQTVPVQTLRSLLNSPPRGYRALRYRYDSQRLIRRPARKGDLWRKLRQR